MRPSLQTLAARFGSAEFGVDSIRIAELDYGRSPGGLGSSISRRVDKPFRLDDGRVLVLRTAGFAHRHRRRWRFEVIAPPAGSQTDPDGDLL